MPPVLERESQLAALRSYADEAAAGDGRLVLVSGEAGVGKSTLVEQLQSRLPGAVWWWGACDGLSTPRALGPLAEIATQAGGSLQAACAGDASRDVRFDALLTALRTADELRVIVVEDVHWADVATLDMLRFLARRVRTLRVLMLVTYRDDALAPDEPLRVTLGDLATHRGTRRVSLGRLSRTAVERLAADGDLDADGLYRLTGGNPFFVAEVLGAGTLTVPRSARDVVLARAAGLTNGSRAVLDCAALIGSHVDLALLHTASSATSEQADELIVSGLLTRDGERLRFRHEIARRAVQDEIAPHRTRDLHRAILEALLAAWCADDAELAFHADAAAMSGLVLEHAPRAGRAAAAVASHREAAAQFERAVRHADGADLVTRAGLYDELTGELSLVDRWDDAAAACTTAIRLWQQIGDRRREGAAETQLSSIMWRLCRGTEVLAAARRARDLLEPLGATEELAALYVIGADAVDADAITCFVEQAAELARELDHPGLRIRALNGIAQVAAGRGRDYETPLTEAVQLALDHGLQMHAGMSYANLTEYYAQEFRMPQTEAVFVDTLAYCAEHDVATYENCARGHYAMALADHGRWDEALRQARTVLATNASPINRLSSLVTAGIVLARRGDPGAATYLDEADAVATGVAEPLYLAWAGLPIAEAAWLAGDNATARDRLARLHEQLTELQAPWIAAVLAWQHRLDVPCADPATGPWAVQVSGPPRRAAQGWDELLMPYHAALALADSDDEADLREAVRRLDPISPPAARRVRTRMRTLGVRVIPTGARSSTRSDPDGLTRREREVLDLVRDNLSNEQIAARLVISTKTVDHHVSAVLAKLGVKSRRDVPAAATAR